MKIIKEALVMRPQDHFVMFSSELGLGKDELWNHIEYYMKVQDHYEESTDTEEI
ncbi:hypothetical protein D3C78_1939180 [compost metagenome]